MSRLRLIASALLLSATGSLEAATNAGVDRVPVLLELFTSEGCSSCPPADRLLETLDEKQPVPGADLIVLSEHVDYWNQLGWKDPFSSPQFSARQQEYTNKFNMDGVYTPQLVVDGRYGFVGSRAGETQAAVEKSIKEPKIPISLHVTREGDQVSAHVDVPASQSPKAGHGVLYVALADNHAESHVAHGENAGRSLSHAAVTRSLKKVGNVDLTGVNAKDVKFTLQPGQAANTFRVVAFVQDPQSGVILAVAEEKL